MEVEQSQNFDERLSQWVSSQGFWFQLRHSLAGSGTKGNLTFHAIRLATRLLIFLVIVAVGIGVYLVRRQKSPAYADAIRTSIQQVFSASESQMAGYTDTRGNRNIGRVTLEGGTETFFTTLEARNIRYRKDLIDDLRSSWDPGTIAISRLDMELRAGADDAAMSQKIADAVFKKIPGVKVETIEVADATLRWGFSERTRGIIEGSEMKLFRGDGFGKLIFRGGTFSQNWLRRLEIISLEADYDQEGIRISKAEFRRGSGTVDFVGVKVVGGERPAVQGTVRLKRMEIGVLIPAALRSFVEGTISGNFEVFGSTNSSDGIGFKGMVTLDGQDVISLRERLHVLKALSVIDYSRNYHRVDFNEGQFYLKTTNGGMELSQVDLRADELFTMAGELKVRLPTPEETQAMIDGGIGGGVPLFASDENQLDERERKDQDREFTLKAAALEARRIKDGKQKEGSMNLMEKMAISQEMRYLEEQAADRASRTLRYEGLFKVTLPADAFERTPRLSAQYSLDSASKRIPLDVPIEGSIYEITLKQAEDLYQQGRQ